MVNELDNKLNDDDTKRLNFFLKLYRFLDEHIKRELSELNRRHHHGSLLIDRNAK